MEQGGQRWTARGRGGWRGWARRRLPVLAWARRYDRTTALADLVAGITLGLTLVPQSIAYAALANLPVHYGLYSAYVGTILYVVLGTVKEVSIGPTSLMALLTLQLCRGLPIEFVVLLTFLSGCIVLLMGLLRLGFLVDLISPSVTSGFTSGTAIIIVVSQLKGLLGLTFSAHSVWDTVAHIVALRHTVRRADCALGVSCCVLLLLLRKLKDVRLGGKRARLQKALWVVSIGRNALVVLAAAALAYCLHDPRQPPFALSGRVEAGLPRAALPPLSANVGNVTLGLPAMVARLGPGLLVVPLVMVLANIAIAKAFAAGGRVDAAQEMVTLGLCNVAGALLHAMPTCGAFTRSAVSHSSGVRTPAAGLYSGIITLLALMFLTRYFYFIPKASLSAVLICAVIFMVEMRAARRLWAARAWGELGVLGATLTAAVGLSVELAALAGAAAELARLLRRLLRPRLLVYRLTSRSGPATVVRPELCLCYLNAERFADAVLAAGGAPGPARPVLVDCTQLSFIDHSAAQVLERLVSKTASMNQPLVFYRASEDIGELLARVAGLDPRPLSAPTAADALHAVGGEGGGEGKGDGEGEGDTLIHKELNNGAV